MLLKLLKNEPDECQAAIFQQNIKDEKKNDEVNFFKYNFFIKNKKSF